MKFEYTVNKETCFYYWIQSISEWSVYGPEQEAYDYYKSESGAFSPEQLEAIDKIRAILLGVKQPRLILASLYSPRIGKEKLAVEIDRCAHVLRPNFELIWPQINAQLSYQLDRLDDADLTWFATSAESIIKFLDSGLETQSQEVYLLQNAPNKASVGHQIEGTDFILLHPSTVGTSGNVRATIGTLLHEYIHRIEFHSRVTRDLSKDSYDRIVANSGKTSPAGITWRMLCAEIIVYCFANNITGGYLRREVFNKPRPTIESMREGYDVRRANNTLKTSDRISWVALNIQDDVEEYIVNGKVFDAVIADRISELILEYF